ncbi:crosslink repair DNA glycosylase YcaQ family protein [Gordonia sp. ABSL11-1]|uniref:winged helix-turn-helix domain-containing protein n=1 Tax=Gordonia sp. ABSL11-1 TaxID=3053924 RepID=UPI00257391D4|nr:crosslink repair DNA glycosylase YcaQ family protein [Gordonia sp. ABSL11-1]MDL9944806.1 crosslink repair DNA glycosylase YcaQ family protein [Gordonia sp. ABSL11-1]
MPPTDVSAAQARRIALAAQGFTDRLPSGPPTAANLRRVIGRARLFQMDSVSIAARAHYMPMFSRLGPYDPGLLERAAWRPRRGKRLLVEYWAHEAALIPVDDWPLFGWRRDEFRDGRYRYTRDVMQRNRELAADVRDVIAETGASTPKQIEEHLGIERPAGVPGGWWHRGEVKHVCEAMFASGDLSAVRNENFVRHYDLTERVIGTETARRHVDRATAHRELTARAASALGVATVADLADYYRTKAVDVRPAVADLVDSGALIPVGVQGWRDPAYLSSSAVIPRRVDRTAILSPFDPLVFFRPRAERLFDFHYRIEIYVPEHKRVHGYYVLPYLIGTEMVARVDLKADRRAGDLLVLASHLEDGQSADDVAARLAVDLGVMARWLDLDRVRVVDRGDLAAPLAAAVTSAALDAGH